METRERLLADMKAALKAGDKVALGAIRLLRASLVELEIQNRRGLSEEEIAEATSQAIRKRREAIEQFKRGNRADLVAKEEREIEVLQNYLPPQLSREDLLALAREAIGETKAEGPGDMGRVMGRLMPRVKGRADGGDVSRLVREILQGVTQADSAGEEEVSRDMEEP